MFTNTVFHHPRTAVTECLLKMRSPKIDCPQVSTVLSFPFQRRARKMARNNCNTRANRFETIETVETWRNWLDREQVVPSHRARIKVVPEMPHIIDERQMTHRTRAILEERSRHHLLDVQCGELITDLRMRSRRSSGPGGGRPSKSWIAPEHLSRFQYAP